MALQQQLPWEGSRTPWAKQIDTLIANALIQGVAVNNIMLNAGAPKDIPTTLNRVPQGWFLIDLMSNAVVWRTKPFQANLLTLEASADTTVSLWIF
jgi:hypothetical protein